MKILYSCLDIIYYSIEALFLLWFLKTILTPKNKIPARMILGLQFVFIQFFIHTTFMQKFLQHMGINIYNSKFSILLVAFIFFTTLATGILIYQTPPRITGYFILVYFSLLELCRFALYPFLLLIFHFWNQFLLNKMEQGDIASMDIYMDYIEIGQFFWNILTIVCTLLLFFLCLKIYKKYLNKFPRILSRQELLFLSLPPFMGLFISFTLRSILITYKKEEIFSLLDAFQEMYVLIPFLSLLCIGLILLGVAAYEKLLASQEEKQLLLFYEKQLTDMKEHVKNMEQLYDGIKGMRHDMKNYVYEIELLLKKNSIQHENELHDYIDNLYKTLDAFTITCQTGNPITDITIQRFIDKSKKLTVSFTFDFLFPKNLGISAFDLSIILNNALENALEACEKIPENSKRFIRLHSYVKDHMFFMEIYNPFLENLITIGSTEHPLTTKEDSYLHGLGLKNIQNCVDKYYGSMDIKTDNHIFFLTMMLQGNPL